MNQQEFDRAAYTLAKNFLLQSGAGKGVTPELIENYLHLSAPRPDTLAALYEHILESAQSANMKAGVIGGSIGGVANLGPLLCDFEPAEVLKKYRSDWEGLLDDIVDQLKPRGSVPRTSRSIWPRYCRSVLSGARFLSQFSAADNFYRWVDLFDEDERARPALPLLLAQEIEGFGFALACDFLNGLGYENFSKPDVHVKDIFGDLGLCAEGAGDYEVFRAVGRLARNAGVTPYNADKLFWLIGSGYFYDDPHIGSKGRIGRHKNGFIEVARERLEPMRHAEAPRTSLRQYHYCFFSAATPSLRSGGIVGPISIEDREQSYLGMTSSGRRTGGMIMPPKCGVPPRPSPHNIHPAKSAGSKGVASGLGARITGKEASGVGPPRGRGLPQKGAIMKKKELIERIAEEAGVPKSEAQRHFEAFEEVVTEALKAGEEVQITGFGKFSVKERKAREGTNPQTGQKMKIAAQKVPSFSAGNALKEAV